MKKSLASIFASLLLLVSVGANAGSISSSSASGYTGDTVSLDVSLAGADFSSGGNFGIAFDPAKLKLSTADISTSLLSGFFGPGSPPYENVLFADCEQASCLIPFTGYIFSLSFEILAKGPDEIPVTIDWFDDLLTDANGDPIVTFHGSTNDSTPSPTVTVLARTVPEPGVLGLTGLALLIMTVVGRRRRVNRG